MPVAAAEYDLLTRSAGVVDRSERGKVMVTGAEAADFLQGQVTNDVEALEPGAAEAVIRHLRTYSIGRDADVEDVSGRWAIVSLIGPASQGAAGAPGVGAEHAQRSLARDGLEIVAVATDLGIDLIAPAQAAPQLRAELREAGAVDVSEEAAEILRVESGRPRFGREMTTATLPQEAGINERAVSFTKGCYIGQETVARLHYKGRPNRHLRGLRLSAPASGGDPIRLDGREVGRVGTAVVSPAQGPIALAVVRREATPGDTVRVGDPGEDAEVVELPF